MIRAYYEKVQANKLDKLHEIETFLSTKVHVWEVGSMRENAQGSQGFWKILSNIKKEKTPILQYKPFWNTQTILSNPAYEAQIKNTNRTFEKIKMSISENHMEMPST